ncbi:MAG: hypothetical protein E7262_05495 [Lachnospiraceae bacterium]|nr:hypothetical protein [Lachnospiraceae bacterium]
MRRNKILKLVAVILWAMFLCIGCSADMVTDRVADVAEDAIEQLETVVPDEDSEEVDISEDLDNQSVEQDGTDNKETIDSSTGIPKYTGKAYAVMNKNVPNFKDSELKTKSYEHYGELDSLGRCTVAVANIGKDLMPREERGAIGRVKPSGWQTVKYDCVDGKYLYNRCHLIGFQLTGENANESNLITGTRYMNVDGMLPFEDIVADYIKETGNHVLYKVTPKYSGENLVASGVQMEAKSVEDKGEGICFNVFVFNIQPGVTINYSDGTSKLSRSSDKVVAPPTKHAYSGTTSNGKGATSGSKASTIKKTYILNTSSKKYHLPSCKSISSIGKNNKKTYKGTTESLEKQGYKACKNCD